MFGRKKPAPKPPRASGSQARQQLSDLGLFDVGGTLVDPAAGNDDDDVADLEAELNRLVMGEDDSPGKKARQAAAVKKDRRQAPAVDLDKMVAACLADDDLGDDLEDDDDPDLLNELAELEKTGQDDEQPSPVEDPFERDLQQALKLSMAEAASPQQQQLPGSVRQVPGFSAPSAAAPHSATQQPCSDDVCAGTSLLATVNQRLEMYKRAEASASQAGDAFKARRFSRGLATLKRLRANLEAGRGVSEEDIPPPISMKPPERTNDQLQPQPPSRPQQEVPPPAPIVSPVQIGQDQPQLMQPAGIASDIQPAPQRLPSPIVQPNSGVPPSDHVIQPAVVSHQQAEVKPNEGSDSQSDILRKEREKYKDYALKAKARGDKDAAVAGLKGVKACDELIKNGVPPGADISELIPAMLRKETGSTSAGPPPQMARAFSRDDPIQLPENPEDLPKADATTFGAPPPPATVLEALDQRLKRYRQDESRAKEEGNASRVRRLGRICKQYEDAVKLAKAGKRVPLEELPTPPGFAPIPLGSAQPSPSQSLQTPQEQNPPPPAHPPAVPERQISRDEPIQMPEKESDIPPPDPAMFGAPPPPKTVLEALNQRLDRYRSDESKAKSAGDASRARRLGRICKQYEDAIKLHNAGRPIPVNELPTPPGYGPFPPTQSASSAQQQQPGKSSAPSPGAQASPAKAAGGVASPGSTGTAPPASRPMTRQEKQLALLEKRQGQFKAAALNCKKAGDMEQAKEYLRQAKGFEKLISASKGGLPVDISTIPVPPQEKKDVTMGFEIVSKDDCASTSIANSELEGPDRQTMFSKLEKGLIEQINMCKSNQTHFKSTGEISLMNKFQQLGEHSKSDLDALRFAFKRGDPVPKFHYEVRAFSKVVCNPDLSDHDLEFSVLRGVSLSPKAVETYCRLEFPYPKETPFSVKTALVKNDSNNPEYNHVAVVPLNMKDKGCQRIFKRQSAKVEVWSKGGFLRSDTLVGTATVKLQPLEGACTLHDTWPLMEGRRAVGGKVEVKLRVRNAVVAKQVERVEEKWLVVTFK